MYIVSWARGIGKKGMYKCIFISNLFVYHLKKIQDYEIEAKCILFDSQVISRLLR